MSSADSYYVELEKIEVVNMRYARYYAAGICGLIGLFTIVNWTQILFNKYGSRSSILSTTMVFISRPTRRILKSTKIWGFVPGHMVLALAFLGINFSLAFTNIDWSDLSTLARRCGWVALCNVCFTVFLGLKNTPLSPLAGRSYESINLLHRCCGYTTILFVLLHACAWIRYLKKEDSFFYLMTGGQYAAFVAGFSLLSIGFTGLHFFRKRQYEVFYIVHVTLVTAILASLIVHLKQISINAIAVIIVAACMWFVDRSLRLSRWIFYGYGNYCTITALPGDATRVVMTRPVKAQPGSHVFLWIPSVRKFQTHPFTLVSNNPAEFVISARDGFTKALYEAAIKNRKVLRRSAIEGPYGNVPNVRNFDKVILIAGGSGITYTMSMASAWMKHNKLARDSRPLDFVWTVKTRDHLDWFENELSEFHKSHAVKLMVHTTSEKISKSEISLPLEFASSDSDDQENGLLPSTVALRAPEKASFLRTVEMGRPDIFMLVKNAVDNTSRDQRVLVAAAGPRSLLNSVRMAASDCLNSQSASVELHLEEFGW